MDDKNSDLLAKILKKLEEIEKEIKALEKELHKAVQEGNDEDGSRIQEALNIKDRMQKRLRMDFLKLQNITRR